MNIKRIIFSAGMVLFVGAVAVSGTGAFFSSQATATGNVFAAGTLDLKLTRVEGGATPATSKDAQWDFSNMAPGGTPDESSIWLRNTGSLSGGHVTIGADFANNGSDPTQLAIGKKMRITTMIFDGNNLLEGGAGATLAEYQEPTTCTVTATPGNLVATVGGATAGSVVCVDAGAYNPGTLAITVDNLTLVALHAPDSVDAAVITGILDVTSDNVTIRGFDLQNPTDSYGVNIHNGAQGITVADNIIHNIGTGLAEGSAQGISIQNGAFGGTGYTITGNRIYDIGNLTLNKGAGSGSSAKGIYLGDTTAILLSDVTIQNNIIHDIFASTLPFNGNLGGRGAYGILTNVNGGTSNLVVMNNTFYNLEALWVHAVGLERGTPNALITLNNFSDFTDYKSPSDAIAVFLEDNTDGATVVVNQNNFGANVSLGVALHPTTASGAVDATNNWWNDFDPSDQVYNGGGSIDFSGFANGPFAGLVNGVDANSNGYADLHDLRASDITGILPGLDPYDGSNDKEFVMAVQLDASADNSFQGVSLSDVTIEFTLEQI
jgi:hypothetical protein